LCRHRIVKAPTQMHQYTVRHYLVEINYAIHLCKNWETSQHQFKRWHEDEYDHNLTRLFTMGASINFITNCSNELQCIPTDFNSFQKCAYKLTMICTQFQATIEPNLGPEFPIATGKIQSWCWLAHKSHHLHPSCNQLVWVNSISF
jgi:hypothetical protein